MIFASLDGFIATYSKDIVKLFQRALLGLRNP